MPTFSRWRDLVTANTDMREAVLHAPEDLTSILTLSRPPHVRSVPSKPIDLLSLMVVKVSNLNE
jgi:hypothetical protein